MSLESEMKPLIGLTCRVDEGRDWYGLPAAYSGAVAAAGGIPVQIPLIPELAAELATRLDAIILCGSASDIDPSRYGQARNPSVTNIQADRDETDFRILERAFGEKN